MMLPLANDAIVAAPGVFLAAADLITLAIAILIMVIGGINQLLTAQKEKAARQKAAPRQPPPPQGEPDARKQLNSEIEEFLKRATESRRRQTPAQPKAQSAPASPPQRRPDPRRPLAPVPTRPKRLVEQLVEAEAVDIPTLHESVEDHVEKHMSTTAFSRRAEHMADDVERTDVEMQQHLTKVFGHQVGRLSVMADPNASARDAGAIATLNISPVSLLTNSQSLRSAIILNEILQRPEYRW